MPSGKQNDISSKLESLESIPAGFAFSHVDVWKKFNKQLNNKRERQKKAMLIAAALVPVFIISYFYFSPVPKPLKAGAINNEVFVKPLEKKSANNAQAVISTQNKEVLKVKKPVAFKILIADPKSTDSTMLVSFADTIQTPAPMLESEPTKIALTRRPKFRIAHINEINSEPVGDQVAKTPPVMKKPFLATVTTGPATDENKIAQKKKYPLSFLSNPLQ